MSDLPSMVEDLEDFTESINMMVYADPGVGKTVWGASDDKVLILATENGTISAARAMRKSGTKAVRKVINCVNDWEKFADAYEWIEQECEKGTFPFQWVVIDTATEMQSLIMRNVMDERIKKKPANRDKSELQDYLETQNRLRRYIGLFNDLPVNVLYLAHAMSTEDEEANTFTMPLFHGKGNQVASWVCASVHAFGYMHMVTAINATTKKEFQSRRIEWAANEKWRAKDRFDCLAPRTVAKSLAQVRTLIETSAGVPDEAPAPAKKAPPKAAPKVAPKA